jgi:hypothetical protein
MLADSDAWCWAISFGMMNIDLTGARRQNPDQRIR